MKDKDETFRLNWMPFIFLAVPSGGMLFTYTWFRYPSEATSTYAALMFLYFSLMGFLGFRWSKVILGARKGEIDRTNYNVEATRLMKGPRYQMVSWGLLTIVIGVLIITIPRLF